MAWPTETDYNEAIQSPSTAFADVDLLNGAPELTRLGLPRPYTGAFATVYRLQCGGTTWAVRCFNREFADQQARYMAISEALATARLPYTVGFKYLPQGIRIRGRWYPILKMQWVEGEGLARYIQRNLQQPSSLLALAHRWQKLVSDLHKCKVAHGDLQHGNVLIAKGDIRLIDYDGMWVPSLTGCVAHELGQKNYQHPRRSSADFGIHIDNFSAWVIYVSLVALGAQPDLWNQFQGGDECLLFRKSDFDQPDSSKLFSALGRSPDVRVAQIAGVLRSLLSLSPLAIPILGSIPDRVSPPVRDGADDGSTTPDWLRDHVQKKPDGKAAPPKQAIKPPAVPDLSWIFEALEPPAVDARFVGSHLQERVVAIFCVTALLAAGAMWIVGLLAGEVFACVAAGGGFGAMFFAGIQYLDQAAVRERRMIRVELRKVDSRMAQSKIRLIVSERAVIRMSETFATQEASVQNAAVAIVQSERQEIEALRIKASAQIATINNLQQAAHAEVAETVSRAQKDFGGLLADLDQKLHRISSAESSEIDAALKNLREIHLREYLSRFRVIDQNLSGIGESLTSRLIASGIVTAADVSYSAVNRTPGIGVTKAKTLMQWRLNLEGRSGTPNALPQSRIDDIRSQYHPLRLPLIQQQHLVRTKLESAIAESKSKAALALASLTEREQSVRSALDSEVLQIRASHEGRSAGIKRRVEALREEHKSELAIAETPLQRMRSEIATLEWESAKLKSRVSCYAELSFGRFLSRMVSG